MTDMMSPNEWLEKAEWEGGVREALEYGLNEKDISDQYPEFRELVRLAASDYARLRDAIYLIEDYEGEDDE